MMKKKMTVVPMRTTVAAATRRNTMTAGTRIRRTERNANICPSFS